MLDIHTPMPHTSQQLLKAKQIARRRDYAKHSNTSRHQGRQWAVDRRITHRIQLIDVAYDVNTCEPEPTAEIDPFIGLLILSIDHAILTISRERNTQNFCSRKRIKEMLRISKPCTT